jgi:hypothetical protein
MRCADLNGLRTFCDVPEAICGLTSEWVLEECRRLDQPRPSDGQYNDAMAKALQAITASPPGKLELLTERLVRIEHEPQRDRHWADSFRYILKGIKGLKPPVDID